MSRIHLVGGEKGGVGKSVMARLLAQHQIDRNLPFRAFDADQSHSAMTRYYAEFSATVNLNEFEQADQIVEAAAADDLQVIVDLAAQTRTSLARWMDESGVLELSEELGIGITLWHVMDDGSDSIRLLEELLARNGTAPDYVIVRNHGRGTNFSALDGSLALASAIAAGAQIVDLPGLHPATMHKIDQVGASFWAAANNRDPSQGPTLGLLERQRVKKWLRQAYAAIDSVMANLEPQPAVPSDQD